MYVSMYKGIWDRTILCVVLLRLFLVPATAVLAQQPTDQDLKLAYEILEERGEIILEIYPESHTNYERLLRWVSLDRKLKYGYSIYASRYGFDKIVSYGIPFRIIDIRGNVPYWKSEEVFPGDWDSYPSHDEYINMMLGFHTSYPEICRLDTLGRSVQGRNILAVKITRNPEIREPEPVFYYTSTMHGDETTGFILMLRLADHLLANYGKDTLVTRLVDNIEIWINPLANPDGTYWNGDEEISLPKRFNMNDADLNRNFPGIDGIEHPDDREYQPENLTQMKFMDSIRPVLSANIHGGIELVDYPWDAFSYNHVDDAWFRWAAHKYADTAQQRAGPVSYMSAFDDGIVVGWQWYAIRGGRMDYVTYFLHGREVTLEVSNQKYPPPGDLPYFWHYNSRSMLQYMESCLFGIQGTVTDKANGAPVEAVVRVQDHEKDRSYTISNKATGYFTRLIEPGTWNLEVSADGYDTAIVRGVRVAHDRGTRVDIQLVKPGTGIRPRDRFGIYPNPFQRRSILAYTARVPGMYRIRLYDLKGRLVLDEQVKHEMAGMYSYRLDASGLDQGIYILRLTSPTSTFTRKIFKTR
jgi:hypothetical protein